MLRRLVLGVVLCFTLLITVPQAPAHALANMSCTPSCAVNFSWTASYNGEANDAGKEVQDCLTPGRCPGLDGNVIEMSFIETEPASGSFTFAPFDAEYARWSAKGFASALDIQYVNDQGTSGCPSITSAWQNMPAWAFSGVPTVCGKSSHGTYLYPDYCSPTFTAELDSFIGAVASHFAADHLAYVRIGTGFGAEAAEVRDGPSSSAWSQMTAWGCTGSGFVNWVEAREAKWQADFGSTPVVSGYNATFTSPPPSTYAEYDAAHGSGISPTNLTPNFNYASIASTMHFINSADPNLQRGYQTDPNVKTSNIDAYTKTAYCYAGGFSRNHAGDFVEWYANVPKLSGIGPHFTLFHNYVNGLATPPGGDVVFCAGQPGF